MKKRFRIPPTIVKKYSEEICFMVETDSTCMEVVTNSLSLWDMR